MASLLSFMCVFLCFTLELHLGLATRNPRFLQDADGDDIGISEIDLNLDNKNSATTNERKLGGLPPLPDLPFGIPNPVNKIKQKFSPSRHLRGLPTSDPRFLQQDDSFGQMDELLEEADSAATNERKLGGLPPLPDLPFGIPNPINKIKEKFNPPAKSSHAPGSTARHLGGLPPLPDLPFGIPNPVNKLKEKFNAPAKVSPAQALSARHLGGLAAGNPRLLQDADGEDIGISEIDDNLENGYSDTTNERKLGGLPPLPDLPFGIPNPVNKIKEKFNPPAKSSPAHASNARNLGELQARNTRFLQEDDSYGISEFLEDSDSATTNERKLGGLPPLPDLPFGIPNPVNKLKEKFNPPAKSSHATGSNARHLGGLPPLPDLPLGIPNPLNKIKEKFTPSGSSSHATGSNARHLGGLPPLPDLPLGIPNPLNKIKEKFSPSGSSSHATGSNARHLGGLPPLPDLPFGIPNPLNKIKGKMSASRNLGGLPDLKLPFPKLPKLPFSDIFHHKEESHSSSHQPQHSPMGTHQPSGATNFGGQNHQQSTNHGTQSQGSQSREEQLQEATAIGKAVGQQIAAEATKKRGQEPHGQGMSSFDHQNIQHSHDPIPHGLSSFDQQHTHLGRDPHDHGHAIFGHQQAQPGQQSHGHGQSSFGQQRTNQGFKPQFYYGHE